jgi:YD repeat-containing protein
MELQLNMRILCAGIISAALVASCTKNSNDQVSGAVPGAAAPACVVIQLSDSTNPPYTTYEYDASGRLSKRVENNGNKYPYSYVYTYTANEIRIDAYDSKNVFSFSTHEVLNEKGFVIQEYQKSASSTVYEYDALGYRVKQKMTGSNHETHYTYEKGNLDEEWDFTVDTATGNYTDSTLSKKYSYYTTPSGYYGLSNAWTERTGTPNANLVQSATDQHGNATYYKYDVDATGKVTAIYFDAAQSFPAPVKLVLKWKCK